MADRLSDRSDALSDLVSAIARDTGRTPPAPGDGSDTHQQWLLAWLSACSQLRAELDEQMAEAARSAARAGASYGELGAAVGTSRQAARKRWPDLPVPARRLLTVLERARSARRASQERREPMLSNVDARSVAVGVSARDWREAVEAGGRLLRDAEAVEERYIDAMLRTVEELGPYAVIAPGVTIPHARPEDGAKKVGLSLIVLSEPVAFGSAENDPVDLVFAFATADPNDHIGLIQALADFLEDRSNLHALRQARTAAEAREVIQRSDDERGDS